MDDDTFLVQDEDSFVVEAGLEFYEYAEQEDDDGWDVYLFEYALAVLLFAVVF